MPFAPAIKPDADLSEVRGHLGDAAKYLLELRSRPADKRGTDFADDLASAREFINDLDPVEKALEAAQRASIAKIEDDLREKARKGARSIGVDTDSDGGFRSIGRQVIEAEGYAEWAAGSRKSPFDAEVRNLIGEFTTGQFNTGSASFLPVAQPQINMATLQRRRAFVRDVLTTGTTGTPGFPYYRELNATTTELGAGMTSEGSAKKEVDLQFEADDAPARKITAWLPITDEMVQDAPTLMSYINARLDYMLMIREEDQELNGSGTAPNIRGIINTPGIQTQAAVSGDFPATIGQAIGKVENVDGEANFCVCNPIDYWVATTKRYANQFDNGFGTGAPGADGNITWGLTPVRTRAMLSGDALVGSSIGATVLDKIGSYSVKVADQHNDNFLKNILVVRAEKRVAMPVWRPALFVDVTVPTS